MKPRWLPVPAALASLAALAALGCHSSSSGASTPPGVYCRAQIGPETICYGYSNLTSDEKSAVTEACTHSLQGTIGGSCPSGEVGCCSTDTAGYQTTECYYTGTASALSEGCSASGGKWSSTTATGPGLDAGSPASTGDGGGPSGPTSPSGPSGPSGPTGPGGTCAAGEVQCPKGCVDEQTDVNNCGSCGYTCPSYPGSTPSCQAGVCVACSNGGQMCDGACVDTANDPTNCGSCGNYCDSPNGGQGLCSGGVCVAECPSGTTSCDDNRVCANLASDPSNCGSCGNLCNSIEGEPAATCVNGACVQTCSAGEALCNGVCLDVTNDINNCGSCGNVCSGFTNECTNGACACQSPVYDNQMNILACCTSNECYINNECTTVGCLP